MPEVSINGRTVHVSAGVSLLAALHEAGIDAMNRSLSGEPRGALCGMGVCFECRALVDGVLARTCVTPAEDGMVVHVPGGATR